MAKKDTKPLLTVDKLIEKMKSKGITFYLMSESAASAYLETRNNFLRAACYRKSFPKSDGGKYIHLDFAALKELSDIDDNLRYLVLKMSLDLEHALKVAMLRDIETDASTDGYDIVFAFMGRDKHLISKIQATLTSSYTDGLITNYFTLTKKKKRPKKRITDVSDCPAWVLMELLSFGDFLSFYTFYYSARRVKAGGPAAPLPLSLLTPVKCLRNGAAHNHCLLADLSAGTALPPQEVVKPVMDLGLFTKAERKNNLSCLPVLGLASLLFAYSAVVSPDGKRQRYTELRDLFFHQIPRRKHLFESNQLLKMRYSFITRLISAVLDSEANSTPKPQPLNPKHSLLTGLNLYRTTRRPIASGSFLKDLIFLTPPAEGFP